MRRAASSRPVLITDAERSQDDQLRNRQIRYATMMGLRVVCLVVAAVLVGLRVPLLWLWLPLCVAGMVLLPWMAVLMANDRPPREKHRVSRIWHRRSEPDPAGRTLSEVPAAPHRIIEGGD